MEDDRRSALRKAAALAACAGAPGWLLSATGCASRPPAPPPPPPRPFDTVLLLPVTTAAREANRGFGGDPKRTVVVPPTTFASPGAPVPAGAAVAALGVTLLVSAVLASRAEAARKEELEIRDAVAAVGIDLASCLDERLGIVLARRGLRVIEPADPNDIAALRAGRRDDAAVADADAAVLDVGVNGSGYYASSRAGGYSPLIDVQAVVRGPQADAAQADEFGYYSDWRDAGKDRRWLTSPPELTFATVAGIRDQADAVRKGLIAIVDAMVELIAADVQRRAQGQPALA